MEKTKDYRLDSRTKEQFAEDIKAATAQEKVLMGLYVGWLNASGKGEYSFTDHGVDNSGEYLEPGTAHTAADFILHKKGGKDKKIEIKFSRKYTDQLHIKISQLNSYSKNKVDILIFMDLNTNCHFTFISHKEIENLLQNGYKCRMWHKDCIRLYTKNLSWQKI